MAKTTVLFTSCGGELAPETMTRVKASSRHDIRMVAVDLSGDAIGRHFADAFHTVPRGDAPGYAERLLDIAISEGVELVQPLSDEEALALSAHRDAFDAAGIQLAANDHALLQKFTDKAATYELLAGLGFDMPGYAVASTIEELAEHCERFHARYGDFVVKPATARGSRGTYVIRQDTKEVFNPSGSRELHLNYDAFRRDEMNAAATYLPMVVMERLVEPVYDVDMLSWNGVPVHTVPRRRIDPTHPNLGHVLVEDAPLIAVARQIIEKLNLSWLIDIDVMARADGGPAVIEINPRPSGSVSTVIAAGVPLYDDMISLARGETLPDIEIPYGTRVLSYKSLKPLAS